MRPLAVLDRHLFSELRQRSVFKVAGAYLVAGWLLIQVADTVAPQFDLPGWVPRLVTLLVMLGFPLALVLAWAFEITPEGIERDARSRNTRFIVAFAVVLTMAALGWFFRAELAGRDFGDRSIAVLPFANLATDADSEVLADGLAEELLGALGRNPAFRVTARSSAFQFKGQNRDLREIGQKLGVRYILEGSLRITANRARIGAQLVDTRDGTQLWSESYERALSDLFMLQRDIAYEVERALEVVLVASEQRAPRGTGNVEAHMELLRALKIGASRAVVDLDQAIGHLQRAIALDPNYAMAYQELAYATYTRALQLGAENSVLPAIGPLVDKALALEPGLGEALVTRGSLLTEDTAEAEKLMREGLERAPSYARGYGQLAEHIMNQDPARTGEAIALLDQAIGLDPLSPRNYFLKGVFTHDAEAAEPLFRKALEVEPRFRMAMVKLASDCMARGEFAEAVDFAERAAALDAGTPMVRFELARQYLNLGDAQALRATGDSGPTSALLYLFLYDHATDAAIALLRADQRLRSEQPGWAILIALLRHAAAHGTWAEDLAQAKEWLNFDGSLQGPMHWDFGSATLTALMRGAGDVEEADRLAAELTRRQQEAAPDAAPWMEGPRSWQRAMLHADAGRRSEALDELEKAFNPARPYWWAMLDGNPMFDSVRDEPRYRALRERLDAYLAQQRALLAEMRRTREVPDRASDGGAGH